MHGRAALGTRRPCLETALSTTVCAAGLPRAHARPIWSEYDPNRLAFGSHAGHTSKHCPTFLSQPPSSGLPRSCGSSLAFPDVLLSSSCEDGWFQHNSGA